MADHDRHRNFKKKYVSKDTPNTFGRSYPNTRGNKTPEDPSKYPKQPMILLKHREQTDETTSPKKIQKPQKASNVKTPETSEVHSVPKLKVMTKAMKLLDEGFLCTDNIQEFVQETSNFLVVGVVGSQSVGKSTILNFLANGKIDKKLTHEIFINKQKSKNDVQDCQKSFSNLNLDEREEQEIFQVETSDDLVNNRNRTNGIDIFITQNRIILLDCQPLMSLTIMDDLVANESRRSSLVSEFIPSENSAEIQALQLTSFLMSVCHILIVVQDWFFDSNICRFIETVEMLRPNNSNPEDEFSEPFPHLLLIHNKAIIEDFSVDRFKTIQKIYRSIFDDSKLCFNSNLGMGTGNFIKYLNPQSCGPPVNLFLIPLYTGEGEAYRGHPPIEELLQKLRTNILGVAKHPLTRVQLTEKTWLIYCSKVWDNVRKSSFFVEYTKLMP